MGYNNAMKINLNVENCKYRGKAIHMDFNRARSCSSLHENKAVHGEIMDEPMQKCHFQPCNRTVPANEHSTFFVLIISLRRGLCDYTSREQHGSENHISS